MRASRHRARREPPGDRRCRRSGFRCLTGMPKLKWKFALPFLVLDRESEVPLHEQLYEQIKTAIKDGRLRDGTHLPSSRELASDAGISRTVTLRAYERLSVEGHVESHSGSGTYVRTALRRQRAPEPP